MTDSSTAARERRSRNYYRYVMGVSITWIVLLGIDRHESRAQTAKRLDGDAENIGNAFHDEATSQNASRKARSAVSSVVGRVARLPAASRIHEVYPDGYAPPKGREAGDDGVLIYQNTLGTDLFRPGRGQRVADDLKTLLGGPCAVKELRVRVSGGVEGGSSVFRADVSLFDGCPAVGGSEIAGTLRRFEELADNAAITHELVLDYSDLGICSDGAACQVSHQNCTRGTCADGSACDQTSQDCADESVCVGSVCVANPPEIPPTVWLRTRFDTHEAGIYYGEPAQVGFSQDGIDDPPDICTANFGGWPEFPHASFWVELLVNPGCTCGPTPQCDDFVFCNGFETCGEDGLCRPGSNPCRHGETCDETTSRCHCASDAECDDGNECNGVESCSGVSRCERQLVIDCNGNDVEDWCDTDQGISSDCDGNDVPDECQTDCNEDGIPDACDVPPVGVGEDCNGNGVADDCEIATFHTCCESDHGTGCSHPDIEACVCASDSFCCTTFWDRLCAEQVESLGCGTCAVSRDCNVNELPDGCEVQGRFVGANDRTLGEVNMATGELIPISGRGLRGYNPLALAFDPNTTTFYGSDDGQFITIDGKTGEVIAGTVQHRWSALTFAADTNTLYGLSSDELFVVDVSTGQGTSVGPIGFDRVGGLAIDMNTGKLYATDVVTKQLLIVDRTTGAGTAVGSLGLNAVLGLAFDPHTNTLFGVDGSWNFLTIDVATGAATGAGQLNAFVPDMAFDPTTDSLYGGTHNRILRINVLNGYGSTEYRLGFGRVRGLAYDPNSNTLFGMANDSALLIAIDVATGEGRALPELDSPLLRGLAFDSHTDTLYGTYSNDLYSIDVTTGTLEFVGDIGMDVADLAFDPNTNSLYSSNGFELVTIDIATGAGTQVGPFGLLYAIEGMAFDPNSDTLYGTMFRSDVDSSHLVSINVVTGAAVVMQDMPFPLDGFHSHFLFSLAFDPNSNTLYGLEEELQGHSSQLITIDVDAATVTAVGGLGFGNINVFAFVPEMNTLIGAEILSGQFFSIDLETGDSTSIGQPWMSEIQGLAYNRHNQTLYVTTGYQLFTLDIATGIGTLIGSHGEGFGVQGLAFDGNEGVLYGTRRSGLVNNLVTIDVTTADTTMVGALGFEFVSSLAFESSTNMLYGVDRRENVLITIDTSTGIGTTTGVPSWELWGLEYISGGGADCNGNLVPDICELVDNDCNDNGLPDGCDILGAAGSDCNLNAILDECETIGGSDFDNDGAINLLDHVFFSDCLSGPGVQPDPTDTKCGNVCAAIFDSDADGDLDLADFGGFARRFFP